MRRLAELMIHKVQHVAPEVLAGLPNVGTIRVNYQNLTDIDLSANSMLTNLDLSYNNFEKLNSTSFLPHLSGLRIRIWMDGNPLPHNCTRSLFDTGEYFSREEWARHIDAAC